MKTKTAGNFFWIRLVMASLIAKVAAGGIMGIFTDLAKTDDWVLEYRYWITGGIYLLGVGIMVGIMLLTSSLVSAIDKDEERRRGETKP